MNVYTFEYYDRMGDLARVPVTAGDSQQAFDVFRTVEPDAVISFVWLECIGHAAA